MNFFQLVIDWSEVWALLIPLAIILGFKPAGKGVRMLIWYVLVALTLNLLITTIANFNNIVPSWLRNNNIFYNIHSLIRVFFLGIYITKAKPVKYPLFLKILLPVYLVFVIVNFSFFEPVLFLSPNLFAAESIVLLIICLAYFFHALQDESHTSWLKQPSFLVCTGICFYEIVTFFIFLFFNTINYSTTYRDRQFARILLTIYAIAFVILCILLAIALYRLRGNKKAQVKSQL